nr:MAG TPA: hypothetical protein [Caudoviricetes sp.]
MIFKFFILTPLYFQVICDKMAYGSQLNIVLKTCG